MIKYVEESGKLRGTYVVSGYNENNIDFFVIIMYI